MASGVESVGMILSLLREHRVTSAGFHPDGSLAHVNFAIDFPPVTPDATGIGLGFDPNELGAEQNAKRAPDAFELAALELAGASKRGLTDDVSG